MSKNIYIALYSKSKDNAKREFDFTQFASNLLTGPFTHVQLCLGERTGNGTVWALNLTRNLHYITFAEFDMRKEGYSYLRLPVTSEQYRKLKRLSEDMAKLKGHFCIKEFYGLNCLCREPCNKNKKQWFCSQLIVWVLQEVGILGKHVNPTSMSCTDIYLLCRQLPKVKQEPWHPFTESKVVVYQPDEVYSSYFGISVGHIPSEV